TRGGILRVRGYAAKPVFPPELYLYFQFCIAYSCHNIVGTNVDLLSPMMTIPNSIHKRAKATFRAVLTAGLIASIAVPVTAQTSSSAPQLRSDRPNTYVVREGDTLWDISGRFLYKPWLWPEIWEANKQVRNPHLIYPGDELALVYDANGRPKLRRTRRGRPLVKLSPSARSVSRTDNAIPTIPIGAIANFLSHPRVVAEDTLVEAPYIVSLGKEHIVAGAGFRVYARGHALETANRFSVYREGSVYKDPDDDDAVLGYEAIHLGDAVLERPGDPATIRLLASKREVLEGDRLLPIRDEFITENFMPRAPGHGVDGTIIEVVEGVTQIGQYQVVVLNRGVRDGLEPGHVLDVYQKGASVLDKRYRDPDDFLPEPSAVIELDRERQGGLDGLSVAMDRTLREVQKRLTPKPDVVIDLPNEKAGMVMVFRSYERVSFALVMGATRPMHVLDIVKNPT
nr:LysM peptidoglycan-binding domain-containing protein [Gammaproteobacteria bacterium]